MQTEILIIGAGAAGLAAAVELSKAGRRVVVIEARDRIGGRMFTQHTSGSNHPIELGAEFIHGKVMKTRRKPTATLPFVSSMVTEVSSTVFLKRLKLTEQSFY